jgi:dihydroorotate dehydrogenase electron transfer subunit
VGKENRNTIFIDEGEVLAVEAFPDKQFIMRIAAPKVATHAKPGAFVHIRCHPEIPMRRPVSLMRVSASEGWIEIYYKVVGNGLRALSHAEVGDTINMLGPIGNGFSANPTSSSQLMIGGGVGIPPMLFLAETLHADRTHSWSPVVFMGSESPFPFALTPSAIPLAGMPADATACVPAIEQAGIPSRLASNQSYSGAHQGFVTDLARAWLLANPELCATTEIYACGPEPMLAAVARLVAEFNIDAQLCLEEYMACAVGGCAGCAVEVHTAKGSAMKRVCVDGPVFKASEIYA